MAAVVVAQAMDRKCKGKLVVSESLVRSYNKTVQDALQKHRYNFVICDPSLPDHPIVYASNGFLDMTGYTSDEVLGRNCRFLQGPGTDKRTVLEIREAIREERTCQVKVLNYTKSRKPFWNLFHLAPVYSQEDGRVVHYVGVQTPISRRLASVLDKEMADSRQLSCRGDFSDKSTSNSAPECGDEQHDSSEDEDYFEKGHWNVEEVDKQRAFDAVKSVLSELAESSNKGVGAGRSKSFSFGASPGTISTSLMLSLTRIQQSFVLADPHLPDVPIVHASDKFLELTGYRREEVVGRNCRFLQGPGTDQDTVEEMRASMKLERSCTVRILNYRKNGEPFWNFLHIAPVRNANGKVAYYTGVQLDVTAADDDEEEAREARMKQLGAVGAIRVAVRSMRGGALKRAQTFH